MWARDFFEDTRSEDLRFAQELAQLVRRAEKGEPETPAPDWLWRQGSAPAVSTVRRYLGNPPIKPLAQLRRDEVHSALEALLEHMADYYLQVDSHWAIDAPELYRFITEELFYQPVYDLRGQKQVQRFCYEDFHPNHEYDLRQGATDFIRLALGGRWRLIEGLLASRIQSYKTCPLRREAFITRLSDWAAQQAFASLGRIEFIKISVEDDEAALAAFVSFLDAEGREQPPLLLNFQFVYTCYGCWQVAGLYLPGW